MSTKENISMWMIFDFHFHAQKKRSETFFRKFFVIGENRRERSRNFLGVISWRNSLGESSIANIFGRSSSTQGD